MAKEPKNREAEKITTLTCRAPDAHSVQVAGTFNAWKPSLLAKSAGGNWSIAVPLPPGRHEYKFIVDDKWCCDPDRGDSSKAICPHCVPNAFGTMNRVIEVR
jgi:1,4-alpha-glucan branching enzyme